MPKNDSQNIKRVAIVGTGVIGAGWAARCLARGYEVVASDPAPGAEARLRAAVDNAWPALRRLSLAPGADPAALTFTADLEAAVAEADFVQESAPENEDLKRKLLARIDAAADLTFYAHYSTDYAGHGGSAEAAVAALERVDQFLAAIVDGLPESASLVVASDHGNLEDLPAGHTRNPVLGLLAGVAAQRRIVGFDLMELAPAEGPSACAFTAARLAYKLMGYAG